MTRAVGVGFGVLLVAMGFVLAHAREGTPAETGGIPCAIVNGMDQEGGACLNVVAVWPGVEAVDIYLDGELFVTEVPFGAATGAIRVEAGEHFLQATAPGGGLTEPLVEPVKIEALFGVIEIAVLGVGDEGFLLANQIDTGPLDAGAFRARVIQGLPDTPGVDLVASDGNVWASDLGFSDQTDYEMRPSGAYDLELRPAGTTDVALPLPNVQFDADAAYTLYLTGTLVDGTLHVMQVVTPLNSGATGTG